MTGFPINQRFLNILDTGMSITKTLIGVHYRGRNGPWFVGAAAAITLPVGGVPLNAFAAGPNNVTICHTPPGSSDDKFSIEVAPEAAEVHYGHGDTQGACSSGGGGFGGGSGAGRRPRGRSHSSSATVAKTRPGAVSMSV